MALTVERGPFGKQPAGRFNFEVPDGTVRYLEDWPRWTRAKLGGEVVADSKRTKLLHETGSLAKILFPEDDVRLDLIPADKVTRWEDVPELAGLVHIDWRAMDEWLEEEEVAFGHVRDPFHRLDVRETSRHVKVSVAGEVVADSTRALALFETSLPTRWYFPPEDVRMDLLERSGVQTTCAYKGQAQHLSLPGERNIAWTYDEAEREVGPIAGRIAFYDEWVDVEVDGEKWERPVTRFKRIP
jgi:uncharacterized protein (DUF427 family)